MINFRSLYSKNRPTYFNQTFGGHLTRDLELLKESLDSSTFMYLLVPFKIFEFCLHNNKRFNDSILGCLTSQRGAGGGVDQRKGSVVANRG